MPIARSLFNLVKSIFDEHDQDGDGNINEEEFISAVGRADVKAAEREAERVKEKYFDEGIGDTVALHAERRRMQGQHARRKHAVCMFQSVMATKTPKEERCITLVDFMCMYFTHLSRDDVKRACRKYAPVEAAPVPKKRTLDDVQLEDGSTAKDEALQMFHALDTDKDGFVGVRSLKVRAQELGITEGEVSEWMKELPPVLQRRSAGLQNGSVLSRVRSKLDMEHWEALLGPVYVKTPKKNSKKDIMRDIDASSQMATDLYNT